jgi:hypothetical protein
VVVSDRASLPEICGDAALYAAPTDADAWFGHFVELAGNPVLRRRMIERGRRAARRFSWAASAERYLKAMAVMDGVAYVPTAEPPAQAREHAVLDIAPARTPSIAAIRPR